MQITSKHLESSPVAVDQWFVESGNRGEGAFLARVTPSGGRLFYFRYTSPERVQVRLAIGTYDRAGRGGGLTVAAARAVALQWAALYKQHRDLRRHFADIAAAQERDAEAATQIAAAEAKAADLDRQRRLSIRQLFDRWASTELAPHVRGDGKRAGRKDGGRYTREQFERRIFPTFGNVAAVDFSKADLLTILDSAKAEGKLRTANVLLADVKQMMRFAVERDVIPHSTVESIRKRNVGGSDVERDRVLADKEVVALAKQLPASSMQARSAIAVWMILATGCRVGELMAAEWDHIDRLSRTWYLPDTKNQRDHTIHLSDFAFAQVDRLASLREVLNNSATGELTPWVFPATDNHRSVCIKSFGKQLADRQRDPSKRMLNRAKDTKSLALAGGRWTAHDLRRTAATLMAGLGVSTDVIDECLNHKLRSKVARVYIRDRREAEQAKAFDALGSLLAQLVQRGTESATP